MNFAPIDCGSRRLRRRVRRTPARQRRAAWRSRSPAVQPHRRRARRPRRRDGPGGSHEQREEPRQPISSDDRAAVAGDQSLRRQRVHRLRSGDARHQLHRERRDAASRSSATRSSSCVVGRKEIVAAPRRSGAPAVGPAAAPRARHRPRRGRRRRRWHRRRRTRRRSSCAAAPAPGSTATSYPSAVSLQTSSGTIATRASPSRVSAATAIFTLRDPSGNVPRSRSAAACAAPPGKTPRARRCRPSSRVPKR